MSKESVSKCPSCGDILPALANVCPSCSYVVGARSEGDSISLQEMVYQIEHTLSQLKALPHPNFFRTIRKNLWGFCIFLSLVFFFAAFMMHMRDWNDDYWGPVLGVGIALCVIPLYSMAIAAMDKSNRKNKALEMGLEYNEEKGPIEMTYKEIKADVDKSKRLAKIFFGEDKKVSLMIKELESEVAKEEANMLKAKKTTNIFYAVMGGLLLMPLLIPGPKKEESISSSSMSVNEAPIVIPKSNIETIGNLGNMMEVLSDNQITITESSYSKYLLTLQIKLGVKASEKTKMTNQVKSILKNCQLELDSDGKPYNFAKRTLEYCGKLTSSLSFNNAQGITIGPKLQVSSDSEDQLFSALETDPDKVIITFECILPKDEAGTLKDISGATINLVLDNLR
jgi:hypothetical protein